MSKNEQALGTGQIGSLVWVFTNERLVIAHEDRIPSAIPSRDRLEDLRTCGWHYSEIARMFDISQRTLHDRTNASYRRARPRIR